MKAYKELLDILGWLIEFGQMEGLYETVVLASFLISSHIGHLIQAIHSIVYHKQHGNSKILVDPRYLDIKWTGNVKEYVQLRKDITKTT